ncbi:hypothetical protein KCP77_21980 [Salmonella enterica subsp. enterica]|nr:hypothetical protein KCP77_21980 [Salmonella enterica subsp. enterica]
MTWGSAEDTGGRLCVIWRVERKRGARTDCIPRYRGLYHAVLSSRESFPACMNIILISTKLSSPFIPDDLRDSSRQLAGGGTCSGRASGEGAMNGIGAMPVTALEK